MAWVEVEEDFSPWLVLAGYLAFGVGVAVGVALWVWFDFVTGLAVSLGGGFLALLGRQFFLQLRLPSEARQAAHIARAFFRERFPEKKVKSVAVRAHVP